MNNNIENREESKFEDDAEMELTIDQEFKNSLFFASDDLTEIVYEQINPEYGRGSYAGIEVIVMMKNGYVNATKLCQLGGKRFAKYCQNDSYKNLLDELVNQYRSTSSFTITIKGGSDAISTTVAGTYVHRDLIPHIASWISARFGMLVSRIVNVQIVRFCKEQMRVKDDRIDHLMFEIKAQREEMNRKLDDAKEERTYLIQQNEMLLQDVNILTEKCESYGDNLDFTMLKLIDTADISVPEPSSSGLKEMLVIVRRRKNPLNCEFNHEVIRAQKRSINQRIASQKTSYPECEIIFSTENANSVNLFNRFRESCKESKKAIFLRNSLRLNGITEEEFIDTIRGLHEYRNHPADEARERVELEEERLTTLEFGPSEDVKEDLIEGVQREEINIQEEQQTIEAIEIYTTDALRRLKVAELKVICRNRAFRGYSTLPKEGLIQHIITCQ